MNTSKKYSLDVNDMSTLVRTALFVGAGAVLTHVADNLPDLDLGAWAAVLSPVIIGAIQAAQRWLKDNK